MTVLVPVKGFEQKNWAKIIAELKSINMLTPRVQKRWKEWENAPLYLCPESSLSFTKSWKQTEGLPLTLRWAKAVAAILDETPLRIWDGELIVGSPTKYLRGCDVIAAMFPKRLLKSLEEGVIDNKVSERATALITDEDRKLLEEDARYWADKLPPDYANDLRREILGEEIFDLMMDRAQVLEGIPLRAHREEELGIFGPMWGLGGVFYYRWEKLMEHGLLGVIEKAEAEIKRVEEEGAGVATISREACERYILAKSMIVACKAIIRYAGRYAALARNMAANEGNPVRKRELEKIAEICDWVPANQPRNFWEALQFIHFMRLVGFKENPYCRDTSLGRIDQVLYPYYEKDLKEGRFTLNELAELLALFWIKTRTFDSFDPERRDVRHAPGTLLPNVTIGGADEKGNDVTNEVSCLILEVMRQLRLSEPAVYVRFHKNMSDEFLIYALECNRDYGGGNPAFLNDELGTKRYLERGVPPKDAVDWIASGCLGYHLVSCIHATGTYNLNLCKIFEITLNNGFDPRTGKQLGLKTGEVSKFTSVEQLIDAFLKQVDYFAEKLRMVYFVDRIAFLTSPRHVHSPLANTLTHFDYTLPKGEPLGEGAAPYPDGIMVWFGDRGTTDIADSIAAIKYLVFDQKKITMQQLLEAIRANWEGCEDIRQMCLNVPKYGNDDPYVDDIHTYIWEKTQEILQKRPDPFTGRKNFTFKGAATGHIVHGRVVGALPNGRLAYTPINDGASSAMPGMDRNAPTATIKSATKVSYSRLTGGPLNMKFSRSLVNTREKLEKLAAMVKTFFDRGGWHIQFNILNPEELIAAKKNPEKYKHLIVRVGGYSAYFVDLPPSVQDEIIARTLHGM
ncbi:MAG: pyruvate formate lyase family protein [Candidatus Bathyarchaeia archaeon]